MFSQGTAATAFAINEQQERGEGGGEERKRVRLSVFSILRERGDG